MVIRPILQAGVALTLLATAPAAWAQRPAPPGCGAPEPQDRQQWMRRYDASRTARTVAAPKIILLGDSITERLETVFPQVWDRHFAPQQALNLGFGRDTTANLLWRLRNGQVDGLKPDAVVIMIGTNNARCRESAEATAASIGEVVAEARKRLPSARIVLLGLLPRRARDISGPVNALLAERYRAVPEVRFVDLSEPFAKDANLYSDAVHPNAAGSELLAKKIIEQVQAAGRPAGAAQRGGNMLERAFAWLCTNLETLFA
jgi:lysophospholipase L1-like esterase